MSEIVYCERRKRPDFCIRTAEDVLRECNNPLCPGRIASELAKALLNGVFSKKEPTT